MSVMSLNLSPLELTSFHGSGHDIVGLLMRFKLCSLAYNKYINLLN